MSPFMTQLIEAAAGSPGAYVRSFGKQWRETALRRRV